MEGVGMGGMMVWMLLWGLLGLALLIAIILGTVWAIRRWSGPEGQGRVESPEELLRRRFAAGEMDEDEYLSRRAHLSE